MEQFSFEKARVENKVKDLKPVFDVGVKELQDEKHTESRMLLEDAEKIFRDKYHDLADEIIPGSDIRDYAEAMEVLAGELTDPYERMDVINFTESIARQMLDGTWDNLIFTDKSARILGYLSHKVLSNADETPDKSFSKGRIYFKNPHYNLSQQRDFDEVEVEKMEKRYATRLASNSRDEKHCYNLVVDEYVASGGAIRKVRKEVNSMFEKYNEQQEPFTFGFGFYGHYKSDDNFNGIHKFKSEISEPSWLHGLSSGVSEDSETQRISSNSNEVAVDMRRAMGDASHSIARIVKADRVYRDLNGIKADDFKFLSGGFLYQSLGNLLNEVYEKYPIDCEKIRQSLLDLQDVLQNKRVIIKEDLWKKIDDDIRMIDKMQKEGVDSKDGAFIDAQKQFFDRAWDLCWDF